MILNTYKGLSLKEIKNKYLDKLIFKTDMEGNYKYEIGNIEALVEGVRLEDAQVIFDSTCLIVTHDEIGEPTADSLIDIYYIGSCSYGKQSIYNYHQLMEKENSNRVSTSIVDLTKTFYISKQAKLTEVTHNPLLGLSRYNTLTIAEIRKDWLNRLEVMDSNSQRLSFEGKALIPLIVNIKLEDARSIFEGFDLILLHKFKDTPHDRSSVDVYYVGNEQTELIYMEIMNANPDERCLFFTKGTVAKTLKEMTYIDERLQITTILQ